MIGQTLGHYEILAELGRGGMGQVFRARDTKLGRDVALKVLPNDVARDTDRLARFQREAQVLAALDCPGIVTVYSVEEDEATHVHFLTMQLVEGQSLDRILPEHGLPLARFLEIAASLADALAAAHEKGIVHRDLKPANIMIKGAGPRSRLRRSSPKRLGAKAAHPHAPFGRSPRAYGLGSRCHGMGRLGLDGQGAGLRHREGAPAHRRGRRDQNI